MSPTSADASALRRAEPDAPAADPAPPGPAARYARRQPEQTLLYALVADQLASFLDRAALRERSVPRFVQRGFRAYLDCGILAHGFLRVHCCACGTDRLVAFSCKGRGCCPSCGARRRADTAAHLVDHVFPLAPTRQWVLSLPFRLRYRLAFDARLTSAVLREFVRAIFSSLKRRAARSAWHGNTNNSDPDPRDVERSICSHDRRLRPQCGAVTFVQRFGDAINLNLHFHTLAIDGVFERDARGGLSFRTLPPLDDAEVARVSGRVARRVERLLTSRGLGTDADPAQADPLPVQEPLLAELAAASAQGRAAVGRRAGKPVERLGDQVEPLDDHARHSELPKLCATVAGFNVHAAVCVPARDRRRLERLCRYAGRPPVSTERLARLVDGRLVYQLKRRWRDGTTHVVFEPVDCMAKLAVLVPPPRFHLVRYHGVLAPCASERDRVVPASPRAAATKGACHHAVRGAVVSGQCTAHAAAPTQAVDAASSSTGTVRTQQLEQHHASVDRAAGCEPLPSAAARSRRRYSWPVLMRRVFAIEVLICERCQGPTRIIADIHSPNAIRAILECLGLPARAPPVASARCEDPQDGLPGVGPSRDPDMDRAITDVGEE